MNIKTANRLYELRKQNNLSQEELANKLGISREAVSKWERAESSPSTDNLIALADIYGISLDELVGKDNIDKEIIVPESEEKPEAIKKGKGHIDILDSIIFLIATIAFLLLGFLVDGAWAWSWLTFLLAIVISSLANAIEDKRWTHFAYPVLATIIFLFLGLAYPGGLWHPTWIIFITIPVYYSIAGAIDTKNGHQEDDDEDDE